jgi:truncated hemoglobin YjbI
MKYDLLGSFNENTLVDYAVICTFYGRVADLGSLLNTINQFERWFFCMDETNDTIYKDVHVPK